MGAKHSVQGNVAQRPRANSVIEAADLRPAGPIRQTASHGPTRHHSVAVDSHFSDDTEPDEEEPQPGPSNRSLSTGTTSNLVSSFRWTSRSPRTAFLNFSTAASPNRGNSARNAAIDRRNNHLLRFFSGQDVDCPVCHKQVPSDDAEAHLVMCFTRPKLAYNEEILVDNRGECVICFEDLAPGQTAARLECLCLYHKDCIDEWFKRKSVCPQHPGDD